MFSVRTKEHAFIESWVFQSRGLEPSWNYIVEYGLLQLKTSLNILWSTPQNQLWIKKKIAILFQNVFSFSLDLTSNLVFLDGFVHSPLLFRVKFQLAPKCRNQNTTEHDEKQEELDGYRFFGTSVRDTRRQRDLLPRRQRPEEMGTLTEVFRLYKGTGLYRVWVFAIHRFGTIMKLHGWTPLSPSQNC